MPSSTLYPDPEPWEESGQAAGKCHGKPKTGASTPLGAHYSSKLVRFDVLDPPENILYRKVPRSPARSCDMRPAHFILHQTWFICSTPVIGLSFIFREFMSSCEIS
jgi:hypothetical protein